MLKHALHLGTAAILLTLAWLLAYAPTVPGGFIKDDFGWVYHSRLDSWAAFIAQFAEADGFYRPIVSLSFGITEALFGTNPIPYALTNIALAMACTWAVFRLALALELPPWAALLAAAMWAFNFHGINMAVVWLSGRTSLFGTLFATLSALAFTRGRALTAGVLGFAALLSKEEVLALPFVCVLWQWLDRKPLRAGLPLFAALIAYLLLRRHSGAFWISDAPPFYQFSRDPSAIAKNFVEYADRAMTFGMLVAAAALLSVRAVPRLSASDWLRVRKGGIWLVLGFALTLWLPVRSSLYVVFPSIGFAVVAATVVRAAVVNVALSMQMRIAAAGLLLPFVFLPVYWARNQRWTELRELTNRTFEAIEAEPIAQRTLIVLEDDLSTRANFRNAFGTMFPEAARLFLRGDVNLWIEPPPPEIAGAAILRPEQAERLRVFRLSDGRVEPRPSVSSSRAVPLMFQHQP